MGTQHACARRADDTIACWGRDDDGRASAPAGAFASVDAGETASCGVTTAGALVCWGADPRADSITSPPAVTGILDAGVGARHGCALDDAGALTCWGYDVDLRATPPL